MIWTRSFKRGLLCVLAICAAVGAAAFTAIASGSEYNLKDLPEIGRCVPATVKEYRGPKCKRAEANGRFDWRSGPGAKPKFKISFEPFILSSAGDVITCANGSGEGTYTGPKSLTEKLTFVDCKQSAATGEAAYCQNGVGSTNGELSFEELQGELGFIHQPKKLKVGWDLRPASGSNLASFECGGGNERIGKSLGTGTKRELQGSVIGAVEPLDKPSSEFKVAFTLSRGGTQYPEQFEHGVKDTLTTLVGTEKTPEATTLTGIQSMRDEESLEVLAKCAGTGC